MKSSPQIEQVAAALVTACGALTDIVKGSTANTGSYSYTYADLATTLQHVRPTLLEHGLAVIQSTVTADGIDRICTRIVHTSGEWLESDGTRIVIAGKAGPQDVGSAITYARRYDLLPMLGLATEDDDGARAQQHTQTEQMADEATQQRVRVVLGELKRSTDARKEAVKAWADGRKLSGHALITDPAWLELVESWLDEHPNEGGES